jgi:hypothetical protein
LDNPGWVETVNIKADGLTKALNPMKQAHFVKIVGLTEVIENKDCESPQARGE